MILKKIHFAIDKTIKADASQKTLLKRYRNYSLNQSNVIVVIGGDGFMLETLKKYRKYKNYTPKISDVIVVIGGDGFMLESLKKYQKYKKPFFGMNKGTFGFLMKVYSSRNHNFRNLFHRKIFLTCRVFLMIEA